MCMMVPRPASNRGRTRGLSCQTGTVRGCRAGQVHLILEWKPRPLVQDCNRWNLGGLGTLGPPDLRTLGRPGPEEPRLPLPVHRPSDPAFLWRRLSTRQSLLGSLRAGWERRRPVRQHDFMHLDYCTYYINEKKLELGEG